MVEITQADREAAASVAVLVEMRELILAGKADHHAEPWARHREAGRRAGLEEAAGIAEERYLKWSNANGFEGYTVAANIIRREIRAKIGANHD